MFRYITPFAQVLLTAVLLSGTAAAQQRPVENPKASPVLLRGEQPASASYRVITGDSVAFVKWLANNVPHARYRSVGLPNVYRISGLRNNDLEKIMNTSIVHYVDRADRRAVSEGSVPGLDLTLNSVSAVHHLFPSITGEGVRVSVKENAFDKDDLDLMGRVFNYETVPDESDQHATVMATIIAGAGNTSPDNRGVAWKSSPAFSDFSNLMPESTATIVTNGITVQNHSYGVGVENYYGIESHAYDEQCVQYPSMIHVFSAGNSGQESSESGAYRGIPGFANLTGQFKSSKNSIAVGGIDRTGEVHLESSRGPASDGRIKPEVVAYAGSGTSEAAAIVSGMCVLAQQAYRDLYDSLPSSDMIRAALINSAIDAGSPQVDRIYGYGSANTRGLITTFTDGRFFSGSVSENATASFAIDVPDGAYRLKITVAWIDAAGDPVQPKALVNDLDLTVTNEQSSATYQPWVLSAYPHVDSLKRAAKRGEDHINNIEQVTIDQPGGGTFTIQVKGTSVPSGVQSFSVAYEIANGLLWNYPMESHALEVGKETFFRWQWTGPDVPATIQWRMSEDETWTDAGQVPLSQRFFAWRAPDVNESVEIRLMVSEEILWTQRFTVSAKPELRVGYHCEDDALLFWPNLDVQEYQLYRLDGGFFVPTDVLSDTTFEISKDEESGHYFAVAPRIGNMPGVRSNGRAYDAGIEYCYVNSFTVRELVSDSIYLDLSLGTNIGLRSLLLERESSAGFQVIAEYSPVEKVKFSLYDPAPLTGLNRYRVRLERTARPSVMSLIEEAWFVRDEDLVYFPNPVIAGEVLNLIVESDHATISFFDAAGRLTRISAEDGEVKTVDTTGLTPGLYIIKIFNGARLLFTARVALR